MLLRLLIEEVVLFSKRTPPRYSCELGSIGAAHLLSCIFNASVRRSRRRVRICAIRLGVSRQIEVRITICTCKRIRYDAKT